jgi:hypothetical protein
VTFFDQVANIGEDEVDPRQLVPGKRDTEVNDNPPPATRIADAVESEVHADLADSTERREDEFLA